jgi:opacity protein-like surface antigen
MSSLGRSFVVGILLLFALASRAQASDFDRTGVYAGLSGSYAIDKGIEGDLEGADVAGSFGIQGRLGYRFHSHFAAEVHAEYLFGFDAEIEGVGSLSYEALVATTNVKLFLATTDIQPYALVGMGLLYSGAEGSSGSGLSAYAVGPAFRAGGGLDFYFSDSIVVNLDVTYLFPFANARGLDYLSIGFGVQYRF